VGIVEDMDLIEKSIRQLQIEWEKFFGGVERKPPSELKSRVEALIRRNANEEIRNNADRFRYQNLMARYSTFSELWNKRLRALEEGRPVGLHGRAAALPPAAPRVPAASIPQPEPAAPARRAAAGEVRIQDPAGDAQAMRGLYERFVEERQRAGETAAVKFENFEKLIAQQTRRILAEKGGQAVDFRLETRDGKVSLKAKAVK
jgi:hypothetical protein